MTIAAADFRTCVIEPALAALVPVGIPYSRVAADLLMATAAVESGLGTYLVQRSGPALGVFQIEPATLQSLYDHLSVPQLAAAKRVASGQWSIITQLPGNMLLAAAICRLFYWHIPDPLPLRTLEGLFNYWKTHYNTALGAGTLVGFTEAIKLTDIAF